MPTIILCLLSGVGGYILGQITVKNANKALGPAVVSGPHGGHGGHGGHHGGHYGHGGWGPSDINIYNDINACSDGIIQDPTCAGYAYHNGQYPVIIHCVKHHPNCFNINH